MSGPSSSEPAEPSDTVGPSAEGAPTTASTPADRPRPSRASRWEWRWPLHRRGIVVRQRQERPAAELQEFLVRLGGALAGTGTAVTDIKRTLQNAAVALGSPDAVVVVFPTAVFVGIPGEQETRFDLSEAAGGEVLFDRAALVSDIAQDAISGSLTAADGIRRVEAALRTRPRFRWPVRVLGHGVIAVGVALVLSGASVASLVLTFVLGVLVGGMKLLVRPGSYAAVLLPTFAAFVISFVAFVAADWGFAREPIWVLVPALVTLLPGGVLTIAVQELAAGDMLAGASRLVYGVAQLVFLAFGILVANQLVGLPEWFALSSNGSVVGQYAAWVGVLLMSAGFFLYFCGPRFSLYYLAITLLIAYGGQLIGTLLGASIDGGTVAGGMLGAFLLTLVAYLAQSLPGAPPAVVCFLPAFWLLVPGASGLIGLTQSASGTGATVTFEAIGASLVAIAIGVLIGMAAYRTIYRFAPDRWHLRLV
ncbi:threonine/serine exporter family protein [Rathayibacter sp. CAU 1779]